MSPATTLLLMLGLTVVGCLLQGARVLNHPRLSPRQLSDLRHTLHTATRAAERDALALLGAQTCLRSGLHKLAVYRWDAVYYADTHPSMAEGMARQVPRLEKSIAHYAHQATTLEQAIKLSKLTADSAQRRLDRATPKPRQWATPDLVLLAGLCWQGWLVKRGKMGKTFLTSNTTTSQR